MVTWALMIHVTQIFINRQGVGLAMTIDTPGYC